MDFNLQKETTFERALRPKEVEEKTKNFSTIEGYVYVISKLMPAAEGERPINCVKVGFSNVTTRERFDKGYQRLRDFRTVLLHFDVHRIYLFERSDFDPGLKEAFGLAARQAEHTLHQLIVQKFKPPQVRINFSNGEASEWFAIDKRLMRKFLKFLDDEVQLSSPEPPVWGTKFTRPVALRATPFAD